MMTKLDTHCFIKVSGIVFMIQFFISLAIIIISLASNSIHSPLISIYMFIYYPFNALLEKLGLPPRSFAAIIYFLFIGPFLGMIIYSLCIGVIFYFLKSKGKGRRIN
jgi:predicted neutral ceramidase superfamily lipid hydrolase